MKAAIYYLFINTLFEIGKSYIALLKNLQSNLYQLKKNKQATETTTKQTTTKKNKQKNYV